MKVLIEKIKRNLTTIILLLIVGLLILGEFRRNSAVSELKSSYAVSRTMLNSRAAIQIILINANLENRQLNPEEIDRIKQLWKKAEYDLAESEK